MLHCEDAENSINNHLKTSTLAGKIKAKLDYEIFIILRVCMCVLNFCSNSWTLIVLSYFISMICPYLCC